MAGGVQLEKRFKATFLWHLLEARLSVITLLQQLEAHSRNQWI